jgi:hypothetical protein
MTVDGAMGAPTFAALREAEPGNALVVELTLTIGFYNAVVRGAGNAGDRRGAGVPAVSG